MKLMPTAVWRTRISPGPGSPTSTSSQRSTSGPPVSWKRIALGMEDMMPPMAKSTRVLLVRHGATVLSAEDRFAGSTDVDLSEEGRRQAQALAERLEGDKLAAVYASPMRRPLVTAAILGDPHKLVPSALDGLREIGHGVWESLTRREVEERFPADYAAWEQDPFTFAPPEGESGLSVTA